MNDLVSELSIIFENNKSPKDALLMSAYMKNKFDFLGIKSPIRHNLQKSTFAKTSKISISEIAIVVHELWEMPYREFQYCACELLEKNANRLPVNYITEFKWLITNKSWWDSVDGIAPRSLGIFLMNNQNFVNQIKDTWLNSNNLWLQRATILFQLKYKEKTDEALLFEIIKKLSSKKDFFIQKAIGWALREHSKSKSEVVSKFVIENQISNLAKREALKLINLNVK